MEDEIPISEEGSIVTELSQFEHLDLSERVEPEVYTLEFIEELCSDAFEYRSIEEHNLCSNFNSNQIDVESQFSFFLFGNLVLGLLVGYIAIRGLFDPWRN